MNINIIYEDGNVLVVDKSAGVVVFSEGKNDGEPRRTMIDLLIEKNPELKKVGQAPRYGIVHRLDKDTSGILLVAKHDEALIFLQKQFKNKDIEKRYICLVEGRIKEGGVIDSYLARSSADYKKQTVYLKGQNMPADAREAITEYKVLRQFQDYTLLEAKPKTGRKHQIRAHMAWLQHPIAGDKVYKFKNSKIPDGLMRQFLHAAYLKVKLPNGEIKEFNSKLPEELETIIKSLHE